LSGVAAFPNCRSDEYRVGGYSWDHRDHRWNLLTIVKNLAGEFERRDRLSCIRSQIGVMSRLSHANDSGVKACGAVPLRSIPDRNEPDSGARSRVASGWSRGVAPPVPRMSHWVRITAGSIVVWRLHASNRKTISYFSLVHVESGCKRAERPRAVESPGYTGRSVGIVTGEIYARIDKRRRLRMSRGAPVRESARRPGRPRTARAHPCPRARDSPCGRTAWSAPRGAGR
jgi:hypothetical protein